MSFEDITLQCKDCGCEFVFSASEQEFYEQKGLINFPKRCKPCRNAKKNSYRGNYGSGGYPQKRMYDTICAGCGCETQVPFQPTGDRPVYCRDCYNKMKGY
ncbi:MAG: zinc-ribbon domain containing protein [Candidatus Gastranaerophilales bacterium]|nr:zinc-ribbon domain containing protein [Candidatus Gastranaerophilales bacterium]